GDVLDISPFAAEQQSLNELARMGLGLIATKQRGIALQKQVKLRLQLPQAPHVHVQILLPRLNRIQNSTCTKIPPAVEDQHLGRCSTSLAANTQRMEGHVIDELLDEAPFEAFVDAGLRTLMAAGKAASLPHD